MLPLNSGYTESISFRSRSCKGLLVHTSNRRYCKMLVESIMAPKMTAVHSVVRYSREQSAGNRLKKQSLIGFDAISCLLMLSRVIWDIIMVSKSKAKKLFALTSKNSDIT
jgi:hypothetical protein